jgi:hypothetical protein
MNGIANYRPKRRDTAAMGCASGPFRDADSTLELDLTRPTVEGLEVLEPATAEGDHAGLMAIPAPAVLAGRIRHRSPIGIR